MLAIAQTFPSRGTTRWHCAHSGWWCDIIWSRQRTHEHLADLEGHGDITDDGIQLGEQHSDFVEEVVLQVHMHVLHLKSRVVLCMWVVLLRKLSLEHD